MHRWIAYIDFEAPKHEAECAVVITSMFNKNHDHVHHALKNKHEDGHVQNLKHKTDLSGVWRSKCSKTLFVAIKAFMHVAKKGIVFLIYVPPTPYVGSH